ncbi:MAG TPA: L-threonylcarbamoyladenylate synthase [Anaerolineales bacterium]|nr:L-threonylcarbamoyladenylate synthase [Anaerolineales bacterium]
MSTETRVISASEQDWLPAALAVIRGGGLVAFPTDTVYGLGGLATDADVVEAIFLAKARPDDKSIPVLVAGWPEVQGVARPGPRVQKLAAAFWPGPLTIVLERDTRLPAAIGSTGTVGVRAPNNAVALALLRAAGPLATSSANLSGDPSPRTAAEVLKSLAGRIDLLIDGGQVPGGRPSTVVDCTGEGPRLLRRGPVPLEAILAAWK